MAIDPTRALQRSIGAARLDVHTFEEVEADESSTAEAGVVVVLSSIIGSLGWAFTNGIGGFISAMIALIAGWFIWAWLSAFIAEKVFNVQTTDTGEMLRTTGYAYAPRALGIIPFVGFIAGIWTLVAVIVGMRQAGEMTTMQAVITALIGFLPAMIALGVISSIF